MKLSYRPDIDGLRAISVLLVLLYHVDFKLISGGFIGVDVFFVISGYLITSILLAELETNKFSFAKFYERRIKRILPPFYLVVAVTLVFGYFLLLPNDFRKLSDSALFSSLFLANIYFWKSTGGYFNSSTEETPLLHLWSLSVEEQFYFLWPVALIIFLKFFSKRQLIIVSTVALVLLIILSEWAAINKPNAAYYFLPTRAGELLVGALSAILMTQGKELVGIKASIASWIGLLLIVSSGLILTEHSTFPGINAYVACIGAALLIMGGGEKNSHFVKKMLSTKPIVFIGLISYPMYLWHWPIVAYLNYLNYELTLPVSISIIVITMLLGWLTWKYLELYIKKANWTRKTTYLYGCIAPILLILIFFKLINDSNGFEKRFEDRNGYADLSSALVMPTTKNGWCYNVEGVITDEDCYIGSLSGSKKGIFIGDSHAAHFQYLVDHIGKNSDVRFSTFITSNCFPSLELDESRNLGGNKQLCKHYRQKYSQLIESGEVDLVVMAARWDANLDWLEETRDAVMHMKKFVKAIVILPQVPAYEKNYAEFKVRQETILLFNPIGEFKRTFGDEHANNAILKELRVDSNIIRVIKWPELVERDDVFGVLDKSGMINYFDDNHLNIEGSKRLTELLNKNKKAHDLTKYIIKKLN